jgi:hypothetical protein
MASIVEAAPNAAARQEDAFRLDADKRPASWTVLAAGNLGVIFDRKNDGVELLSLFDRAKHRQLLAEKQSPLFMVVMRHAESKEQVVFQADVGWEQVKVTSADPTKGAEFSWQNPKDKRFGPLKVTAVASLDAAKGAVRWKLAVDNVQKPWIVRRVVFPQVVIDVSSESFQMLYPSGCGKLEPGPVAREYTYAALYPNGWASMQFLAGYDVQLGTGLYCAMHDPLGGTKEIKAEGRAAQRAVAMMFDVPAENMNTPGNGYTSSGEAVWQLLHGDWFDAAMIYRQWVRGNATWYPKLAADGRADTPQWMRELSVWLQMSGDAKTVVPEALAFAKAVNVPVGLHWYCWHKIPFDSDYPHYFPVKDGFGEAVKELQSKGVHVMPYINGRLWDTRDKGMEDFEFTRVALPAATKDEDGKPYIETYGSKEADGSDVRLAVMCPSTELWQAKVREVVLRLMNEYGVHGVYIDQIAAAPPVLCFDRSHGHPTGGGSWWTASYNRLMEAIRQAKPADRMLTTECNAEPFAKNFDGYLTWHWCRDRQVPVFPAVYGGAIQMFGRAYREGGTKELALRMKAGQQFVFGEQIGWFGPNALANAESAAFLEQVVKLRWQLRRYFHAGEMARPPKLEGSIPTVRADWQWDNPGWVTTDAAMSGAWLLPSERRCVLLFTNVSDQPVTARLKLDAAAYGLGSKQVKVTTLVATGQGETFQTATAIDRSLTLPPRSAVAWELTPLEP